VYLKAQRQRLTMLCISRSYSMLARVHLLFFFFALWLGIAAAYGQTSTPPTRTSSADPTSLPARDLHQGLLIAADPYTSADRYKEKFGKHTPYDGGIIAIELFFRNDNDSPIRINLKTMQLLMGAPGGSRQRLEPLSPEDVADRVLAKPAKDPTPRFPVPRVGPPPSKHDKNWEEFAVTVRSAALGTDLLPPHATTHGFVYFDINRHYDWISNARLEIPDLAFMNDTKPLFFFEIDLAPSAH
jgi:hypothetical protein